MFRYGAAPLPGDRGLKSPRSPPGETGRKSPRSPPLLVAGRGRSGLRAGLLSRPHPGPSTLADGLLVFKLLSDTGVIHLGVGLPEADGVRPGLPLRSVTKLLGTFSRFGATRTFDTSEP